MMRRATAFPADAAFGSLARLARTRGCAVPEYRFYELTEDDHVIGPPALLEFDDDETAVAEAEKWLDKTQIEVWQRDRRVIQLSPK